MQHQRHASCVSYAWEYDAGIQEWQRGVRRCEPNASLDGVCVGAAADGFLYNVSHADVRHRCARDDRCVGYTRDPQKSRILPLASLHNRVTMVPGRVTYRKVDDYCGLPLGLGDGQRLHEAMRSWAAEAAFRLATERANTVRYLREHLGNLTQFSAQNRLATPRMPVLYLCSGADLLTARALSPGAPAYVLSSALPFGDARCFLYDECRGRALGKLFEFVMAWRSTQFWGVRPTRICCSACSLIRRWSWCFTLLLISMSPWWRAIPWRVWPTTWVPPNRCVSLPRPQACTR